MGAIPHLPLKKPIFILIYTSKTGGDMVSMDGWKSMADPPGDMVSLEGWKAGVQPPILLFYVMGIWSCVTGLTGITANVVAIVLFTTSKKVETRD